MIAVAYCRVSTLEQSLEGVSLEMQRERIAAWCTGNGYELTGVFVEAMSGSKADNRNELQKALAAVCKARGVLVVYSLSRLARSVRDTLAIADRLERASANLASLTERIDTNSAMGKMVFRLLSTLNEFERDQLSERTEGAMAHLRRAGRRISGRIPFGYDLAADGRFLTPNVSEQVTLRRIISWRDGGCPLATIGKRLTDEGTPTKRGRAWYPSTVKAVIDRHRVLGGG